MSDSNDAPIRARTTSHQIAPSKTAAVAEVIYGEFDELVRKLQSLLIEMTRSVDEIRQEQEEALYFASQYGIGPNGPVEGQSPAVAQFNTPNQAGVRIAHENVRASLRAMSDEASKRIVLYDKIQVALATVRDLRRQFGPGAWDRPIEPMPVGQAVASAREDERRRVARELHDGPAQILANAVFSVEMAEHIAERSPELVTAELDRLRDVLKLGMAEVRRLMFDLRPSSLDDLGLVETIRQYVHDYNHFFGKEVELHLPEELPPLTPDESLSIFRIVQESLQNVQKHAQTTSATVSLSWSPPHLALAIVDHGRGFRPETLFRAHGERAGVRGMQERAELIGGNLTIASQPGAGTSVRLDLDLSSRAAAINQPGES